MLYMRGSKFDYDGWEQLGNEGWGYYDCLPYFKRLEFMKNRVLRQDSK